MLNIAASKEARIYVINLRGRIDGMTAHEFEEFFTGLIEKGTKYFLLNAKGLDYISSSGIAGLLSFLRKVESVNGACAFIALNDEISQLISFFGLDDRIKSFSTQREASDYISHIMEVKIRGLSIEEEGSYIPDSIHGGLKKADDYKETLYIRDLEEEGQNKEVAKYGMVNKDPGADLHHTIDELSTPVIKNRDANEIAGFDHTAADTRHTNTEIDTNPEHHTEQKKHFRIEPEFIPEVKAESAGDDLFLNKVEVPVREIRPVIIHCEQCQTQLRIKQTGYHLCPSCNVKFEYVSDGSVRYFEKL